MKTELTIAITIGDPAGVGPEVIAKALAEPALPKGFRFEVIGLDAAKKAELSPGHSTIESAQLAWNALNEATAGWREGRFAAIVTGPVSKGDNCPNRTGLYRPNRVLRPGLWIAGR